MQIYQTEESPVLSGPFGKDHLTSGEIRNIKEQQLKIIWC